MNVANMIISEKEKFIGSHLLLEDSLCPPQIELYVSIISDRSVIANKDVITYFSYKS